MPKALNGRGLSLAIAAALLASFGVSARADIVRAADMLRGIQMTEAQCAARPQTVWVRVVEEQFCIRYYLSTAGGQGRVPLVFLRGDTFGRLELTTGAFAGAAEARDVDTARFERIADLISEEAGVPAIYLGRIGLDGSSGHHRLRRTILELNVTNAALDAIKRRHGFRRSDIGCAVLGSGLLASLRPPQRTGDPSTQYFNVAASVANIARKPASRIFVVTDPADRRVPRVQQTGFVDALRAAGGRAEQVIVQATDENHHGVVAYSRTVVNGCLRGLPMEEIEESVQRQVRFLLARKAAGTPDAPE
jgi:hypothetical protein